MAERPLTGRTIGILALQGDVRSHAEVLESLGASVKRVRVPEQLAGLDGLVLPGGESTTMTLGIKREGLADPLREAIAGGLPVLATCAGLILLDDDHLAVVDLHCERNAFGAQLHSFECDLAVDGVDGEPVHAVFIRAPRVTRHGAGVEVIASVPHEGIEAGDDPSVVAIRSGNVIGTSFHPEQAGEPRLHMLAFAG
ncbi:MAG: pyridoxal 5'-phosphate synthase glutaminase subunit PdxT [Solirubrobacteraceae bacterium]|nr:pyridoxal 5'-phosphate synthase glutaminase subunit PdxT [Solirubrobacteraceae bacterium]